MSENPVAGAPATVAADPNAREGASIFPARVALIVTLVLGITVIIVVIPLMVYLFVTRSRRDGRRGLAAGILRSITELGSRRHGLDTAALCALPVTVYRKESGGGGARAECAVCLSELADGDEARELPNCGHLFHLQCVDAWLRTRTTCPLCRVGAELADENGKAQSSLSAATERHQPALLGGAAGGSLTVTVHGGSPCTEKDARGSTSGSPCLKK